MAIKKVCKLQVGCHVPFQVRALAGPFKDIQRLVPKPLLRCLDCVLRVIVLLEGEPSPQSEVLSTLGQVFSKDLSVLNSVHLSPLLTSLRVPAVEKPPDRMKLPQPCFTIWMVLGFLQVKEFHLAFIRPENLVSHGLSHLGAFWPSPNGLSCAFY